MRKISPLVFSTTEYGPEGGATIMLGDVSSHLVFISNKGLRRVSTVCPQLYVDYEVGNLVKINGVDIV